ncbi:MAG: transketolase [Ardenticatenaceae bacterium]|nr:transketolase [Ardenticatenaceae bacterium]MCB9003721.1 transketolase [Ardenticatenaceae bacterium]
MADVAVDVPGEEEADLSLRVADVLDDYRLALESRFTSLVGRREVFSGRAKFGIFGDGKEVAQLAMARVFRKGDFRSGYYRDQTFMFATGMSNIREFFAQLYAHTAVSADPHSAGRQMNAHFATRLLNSDGSWKSQTDMKNTSADVSPTASQMPRLVGLAYASRLYRELDELHHLTQFSRHGSEIAFGTIGNASCAEGMFWESVNAIGVLKSPAIISIWDDGYGISVPNAQQITKENLSALLAGFQTEPGLDSGFNLYTVRGWDYPALVKTYQEATAVTRQSHTPSIIHVIEMTQPQGHSTSGSHERYKSKERLAWEETFDGIAKMREWIIESGLAAPGELDDIEHAARAKVEKIRTEAWEAFVSENYEDAQTAVHLIESIESNCNCPTDVAQIRQQLLSKRNPLRRDIISAIHDVLIATRHENPPVKQQLITWRDDLRAKGYQTYDSHLYSSSAESTLNVPEAKAVYSPQSPFVNGFEVLNTCFDAMLARDPRVVAFGEDVGRLGGVNQTFAGLQAKYGPLRVSDTGIREATILGQAIGLAMRGLRPIAEIQYLDYLLYALQLLSDDLATVRWRTAGGQKAPVIVSTRGHRLEGMWHAGSPMAGIINLVRGVHVLVPRNMTQAAGFYNTLLQGDDPAIVVEVLNGYRLKEKLPDNIAEFTVPLGMPEVLRPGNDVTVVTYGACCRIAMTAAEKLRTVGIEAEVLDVQSLLPFDRNGRILQSLQKTNRILFLDEDVPGGTTAYMMQQVIEEQGGYWHLDSEPRTLSATAHRPAYGSDGAYFSKPNVEAVFDAIYEMMNEAEPARYPIFYK